MKIEFTVIAEPTFSGGVLKGEYFKVVPLNDKIKLKPGKQYLVKITELPS